MDMNSIVSDENNSKHYYGNRMNKTQRIRGFSSKSKNNVDGFDQNAVPLQTTNFEFNNIHRHPNFNNRKYAMMYKTQIGDFKNNTEKPIFIVSGKSKIVNQKQQIVHPKAQIIYQLTNNFSQSKLI